MDTQKLPPIFTADLFPLLDEKLLEVLKSLSFEDWQRPTIVPRWCVKDIATHLLDGNIRHLSMIRDSYFGVVPPEIKSYQDLVNYLNNLNAEWVQAHKRVSPKTLISLLESTGKEFCEVIRNLPPFDKALFSVAWAGEEESQNWFHIAREYTEKWHHQQQIRLAVGKEEALYTSELYAPHLATSMRALPHHYRNVEATEGTCLRVSITGEAGGDWHLHKVREEWQLSLEALPTEKLACHVTIYYSVAWRIFTKGISRQEAEKHIQIQGEQSLGLPILSMLAVMA